MKVQWQVRPAGQYFEHGTLMHSVFIGLPVYNGAEYLRDAIESVLNQTYRDFRLLISDNASTDGTEEICKDYARQDPRIVYHRHARNMGAAPNFNFCVDQASGKYFKWMTHDDICRPTYLERCVETLERDQDIVLCHARVQGIDETGRVVGDYAEELNFNHPDPVIRFSRAMALNHGCVSVFGVMRLHVLKSTARIAPFIGSDRPLLAEMALHGRLEYVPEPLFLWREHKNRSIRLSRNERLEWFDTHARGVNASLYFRQLWANQKAVTKSQLPAKEKLRGLTQTLQWCFASRRQLFKDVRTIGKSLILPSRS